jgi:hypothetical protein
MEDFGCGFLILIVLCIIFPPLIAVLLGLAVMALVLYALALMFGG